MPTPPLPDEVRALLEQPHHAVVATLRDDGAPVTVATWYALEPRTDDGRDLVLVNMDHTRRRVAHLRRDPRVALTVLDRENWYTHVSLVGRVVDWRDDSDLRDIDRLSRHYRGRDYPNRESPRISAWFEIERWHGWGETRT